MKKRQERVKDISLEERITHLLNELRIVLPGTEALLGFQFASVFTDQFQKLSFDLRVIHLISLCFILLSIIFLLAAPAFNRIVEPNKATLRFHNFASRVIILALFFLACGMSIELYVVGMVIMSSPPIALTLSVVSFLLCMSLWFGYSLVNRNKED
jgi:hypothetical protein